MNNKINIKKEHKNLNLEDIFNIIQYAFDRVTISIMQNKFKKTLANINKIYKLFADWISIGNSLSFEANNRACRSGCHHCCHQVVPITVLEGFVIINYIKTKLSKDILISINNNIKVNAKLIQNDKKFKSCVFLGSDNKCMIYHARPLRCRGYFSLDENQCEKYLTNPSVEIPVDGYSIAWTRGTHSALTHFLQANNLDYNYYELHNTLYSILLDNNSLKKWFNGKFNLKFPINTQAHPHIIWAAPQTNGATVYFTREKEKIKIKLIN